MDKSKALLTEVFKLLGNRTYRKMIEAVEQQTCMIFIIDEKVVDRTLRGAYFEDLNDLGQPYELESRNQPFQVGIAVYQLGKLPMLEFWFDSWIANSIAATFS